MSAYGHEVDVSVFDRDAKPVADVVVYALRLDGKISLPKPDKSAVMDQIDMQFVPHVLVVQSGTAVDFPNSDSVAHHVYSFSHPNKFVLPMYKGEEHPPVLFEHSGVVSLGCNIHDHMLGYILVIDSTIFATTNENGQASLSLDKSEEYAIAIWSQRIRDKAEFLSKEVTVSDATKASVTFSLAKKLNPPHGSESDDTAWSDY
jgi:plastocyanin